MTALLREGLRELGLDESRAETLERFAALLLKKNEVMNLTAITEPEAVTQLHLLDSAALTQFVDLSGKRWWTSARARVSRGCRCVFSRTTSI